eukprot:scaffold217736_cov27-Tisochrysis_lutea.AAC.1
MSAESRGAAAVVEAVKGGWTEVVGSTEEVVLTELESMEAGAIKAEATGAETTEGESTEAGEGRGAATEAVKVEAQEAARHACQARSWSYPTVRPQTPPSDQTRRVQCPPLSQASLRGRRHVSAPPRVAARRRTCSWSQRGYPSALQSPVR